MTGLAELTSPDGGFPVEYYERASWTSVARPAERLIPLIPSEVAGLIIHQVGSGELVGATTSLQRSAQLLEAERNFHTSPPPLGRGWSDIAYSVAIDVEGRVFECRGIEHRPAGNGKAIVNRRYGSVTWILGEGERPTEAMRSAFIAWRQTHWLARHPRAVEVVGHRDVYATDCPGEAIYALIRSGSLTRGADVPLTDAEIDAVATRTRDKILAVAYGSQPDGRPFTLAMLWGELRVNAIKAATGVDVNALATAIVAKLPPGNVDAGQLASAVADELALRLKG